MALPALAPMIAKGAAGLNKLGAAKKAGESDTGKKVMKAGCLVALAAVTLPVLMFLALLQALVRGAVNVSDNGCAVPTGNNDSQLQSYLQQNGPVIAVSSLEDAGLKDQNQIIVMTAIAGAQSGYDSNASGGYWEVPGAPTATQDPDKGAAMALQKAGGSPITTLSFWSNNEAYQAFAAAGGVTKSGFNWSVAQTVSDAGGWFAQAMNAYATVSANPTGGCACGGTSTGSGSGSSGSISAKQTGYSRTIIGIAKTMNMGTQGEVIAIMVALTESSIQEYANSSVPKSLSYPHDAVGSDHGSVGIFQQQVNLDGSDFGWGTLDQLMNASTGIQYQAYRFLKALQGVSGWQNMSPWLAAQAVQRSAFSDGSNYERNYSAAQAIVSANQDAPAVPLPAGATSGGGSGGSGVMCTAAGNASTQSIEQAATALDALNWMYCQPASGYTTPQKFIPYPGNGLCRSPGGLDCAGTVGYVLQHGGLSNFQTSNSTGYMGLSWQKLGSGPYPEQVNHPGVQIYASVEHTFLVINGRVFSSDTESSPTGGPHWRTWSASSEESGNTRGITWVVLQVPGTS